MKNKLSIVTLTILMLGMVLGFKSTVNAQPGSAAVPFLLIGPDARAAGMGGTGTAIANDLNAVFWNPAGLGFLDYFDYSYDYEKEQYSTPFRQVSLAFSPWLPQFNADLYYSSGTFGQYFEELDGTIAVNFVLMNLGEFTRTDAAGNELGKFVSNEFALGFSYGTIIAPDLSFGFQLKYIQSNLTPTSPQTSGQSGTGISGGFDMGVLWKPVDLGFLEDRFSIGMNLQNVGPKMTYINESDPLPTNLRLGIAYKLVNDDFNQLSLAVDFAKLLVNRNDDGTSDALPTSFVSAWQNPGAEFSLGLEYWYEDAVALRAGYFDEPDDYGARQFWTFGLGVAYEIFKLDFSFINTIQENHPLANTMRFSMLIDWN